MATVEDIQYVVRSILEEHNGDYRQAFYDLAGRFVAVVHGVSPGFLRWSPEMPSQARIDDVPNPITDEWIRTGIDP